MNSFKILFACLVLAMAVSAQRVDLQAFDSFSTNTVAAVIVTPVSFSTANPIVETASGSDANIVGGERDLAIVAEEGEENAILNTGVVAETWSVSTSPGVSGFGMLQYDGVDGVTQLDGPTVNGLSAFDLTLSGSADAFHFIILSDNPTEYEIVVYDSNNNVASFTLTIPGSGNNAPQFQDFIVTFAEFSGSINFSSVGAVEIIAEAFTAVDTQMRPFFLSGFEGTPSPSIPPVPTPAPVPSPNGFTWYTFDDDDNGRSPCGDEPDRRSYFLSDDNIVYYYFFGFDFTTQEVSSSDAATAVLSTAAALAGVAAAVL